jgi:acyl carrier protein
MSTILDQLKNRMLEHLKLLTSVEQIDDNAELTRLGLDSMAATNLMIDIEDDFGVQFPDNLLTPETFRTPLTLEAAIQSLLCECIE